MISTISIRELKPKLGQIPLIDIRSIESYNSNHIPTAINIPFEQLIIHPEKYLRRDQVYYIYCSRGIESLKAIQILSKQGYHFIHVNGGYQEWVLEN